MTREIRTIVVLSGLLLLVLSPQSGRGADTVDADEADEILGNVDIDLNAMKLELDAVAKGYGSPVAAASTSKVERRFREGEIHFLLEDYLRASIMLLDIVDDAKNQGHPQYNDCVFFLAESLRRTQNYSGARHYFEQLLPSAQGDRLKDVVLALLEIASATGRYEPVERYISRLRSASGLARNEVDYIHAKMLFRSAGDDTAALERAYQTFKGIPAGSRVSAQAAYYAGVVLVGMKRYQDAIAEFQEALRRAKTSTDRGALADLSRLSLARIHQELGKLEMAVESYTEIGKESPHFSDMLFEVAWAHVKAASATEDPKKREENLTKALRTAELLMATAPDSQLFPEARILEGNLQIRLGAPETGYETFQTIIDRYGGARSQLAELIANNPDPKKFFDQLVALDMKNPTSSTNFIPPIAISWAVKTGEMKRAVGMMQELKESEINLAESKELLRMLSEALSGEHRYNMFSGLSEARSKAFGVENRVVLLHRRLLNLERKMLLPTLSAADVARLDANLGKREALEAEVQALPQDKEAVENKRAEIQNAYEHVNKSVFRTSYAVASMRSQVIAIDVWLNQNRDRLSSKELDKVTEQINAARAQVAEIESKMDLLQADIRTASTLQGGDAGRAHALRVREEYLQAMTAEIAQISTLRSQLPSGLGGASNRIDQQRDQLKKMVQTLGTLQVALDEQVDAQIADIREALATEHTRLSQYENEYGSLRGQTDELLGPVAKQTLSTVAQQFQELVTKADVGIIDVAWARKQDATSKVSRLLRDQQEQTQKLEAQYAGALEGGK